MNKRQKKKFKRCYNKKLCERYPFLIPHNRWTDKIPKDYNYDYTEWDAMPDGWRKAFGDMMLEELRESLIEYNYLYDYRIMQLKEKYGSLRLYSGSFPNGCKCQDIIDKYEAISVNVCICCGKPDVPIINNYGWLEPLCKKCFQRISDRMTWIKDKKSYEEMYDSEDRTEMTDHIIWHYYSKDSKDNERRYDFPETVEKIRARFNVDKIE